MTEAGTDIDAEVARIKKRLEEGDRAPHLVAYSPGIGFEGRMLEMVGELARQTRGPILVVTASRILADQWQNRLLSEGAHVVRLAKRSDAQMYAEVVATVPPQALGAQIVVMSTVAARDLTREDRLVANALVIVTADAMRGAFPRASLGSPTAIEALMASAGQLVVLMKEQPDGGRVRQLQDRITAARQSAWIVTNLRPEEGPFSIRLVAWSLGDEERTLRIKTSDALDQGRSTYILCKQLRAEVTDRLARKTRAESNVDTGFTLRLAQQSALGNELSELVSPDEMIDSPTTAVVFAGLQAEFDELDSADPKLEKLMVVVTELLQAGQRIVVCAGMRRVAALAVYTALEELVSSVALVTASEIEGRSSVFDSTERIEWPQVEVIVSTDEGLEQIEDAVYGRQQVWLDFPLDRSTSSLRTNYAGPSATITVLAEAHDEVFKRAGYFPGGS